MCFPYVQYNFPVRTGLDWSDTVHNLSILFFRNNPICENFTNTILENLIEVSTFEVSFFLIVYLLTLIEENFSQLHMIYKIHELYCATWKLLTCLQARRTLQKISNFTFDLSFPPRSGCAWSGLKKVNDSVHGPCTRV